MRRFGVIAIGSNATRLLVADRTPGLGNEYRGRKETRLFLKLGDDRALSMQAMEDTALAVRDLIKEAALENAESLRLFATSATRDAVNAADFRALLLSRTGLSLEILSGAEEARLSFIGATDGGRAAVIDIGGGSTELIIGENRALSYSVSAQMGASRLFRAQSVNSRADADIACRIALDALAPVCAGAKSAGLPDAVYLVGGTGTALARMCQNARGLPEDPEGFIMTRSDAREWLARLADTPAALRGEIPGLPQSRADIMPTGLCVLLAVFDGLGVREMRVTMRGNADGYLKEQLMK